MFAKIKAYLVRAMEWVKSLFSKKEEPKLSDEQKEIIMSIYKDHYETAELNIQSLESVDPEFVAELLDIASQIDDKYLHSAKVDYCLVNLVIEAIGEMYTDLRSKEYDSVAYHEMLKLLDRLRILLGATYEGLDTNPTLTRLNVNTQMFMTILHSVYSNQPLCEKNPGDEAE